MALLCWPPGLLLVGQVCAAFWSPALGHPGLTVHGEAGTRVYLALVLLASPCREWPSSGGLVAGLKAAIFPWHGLLVGAGGGRVNGHLGLCCAWGETLGGRSLGLEGRLGLAAGEVVGQPCAGYLAKGVPSCVAAWGTRRRGPRM